MMSDPVIRALVLCTDLFFCMFLTVPFGLFLDCTIFDASGISDIMTENKSLKGVLGKGGSVWETLPITDIFSRVHSIWMM